MQGKKLNLVSDLLLKANKASQSRNSLLENSKLSCGMIINRANFNVNFS